MGQLSLSNIITISVSATPTGLNAFNTSNLALFSTNTPGMSFGSDDFKIYKTPGEVGTDFGTGSTTYKMAVVVFSQQPNILANNGSLIVIPFEASETLDEAIARTAGQVQYFGFMSTQIETGADMQAAGALTQTLTKMAFFVQRNPASIAPGGDLDDLRSAGLSRSRGLYYGAENDLDALLYQAAYAGRALSVVFSGSNTTITMHLKDLITVQPDLSLDQTLLNKAVAAGADTYPSFEGVAKVYCSGTNSYFDQVYNLLWFVAALQVAGFNYLATSSSKVPQTESGMDGLKNAYRKVCQQAVINAYSAPGTWNSATTFGDQGDFLANILNTGYYVFSLPIAVQSQEEREARQAPLVQIALKEAGAIHSSSVVVYVNA